MRILVINGPNINMLGIREPEIYGRQTYEDLVDAVRARARELGCETDFFQSNHEGDIVDAIQGAYGKYDGIIINPAAYTHTSIAILDALKAVGIKTIEVHLTDVDGREDFRSVSYVRLASSHVIAGEGIKGYVHALDLIAAGEEQILASGGAQRFFVD